MLRKDASKVADGFEEEKLELMVVMMAMMTFMMILILKLIGDSIMLGMVYLN